MLNDRTKNWLGMSPVIYLRMPCAVMEALLFFQSLSATRHWWQHLDSSQAQTYHLIWGGIFFLSRSPIRAGVNPAIELKGFVSLGGIVFIAPGRNIATAHWLVVMPGWQDKGWCLDVLSQPWPRSDLCAAYLAGLYRGPTRWGPFALCISNTSSYAPLLWGSGWINSKMLFWPGSGSSFKTACIINFALIF